MEATKKKRIDDFIFKVKYKNKYNQKIIVQYKYKSKENADQSFYSIKAIEVES